MSESTISEYESVEVVETPVEQVRKEYDNFVEKVTPDGRSADEYPKAKESGYLATGRMIAETRMPPDMFPDGPKSAVYYDKHQKLKDKMKLEAESKGIQTISINALKKLHENVAFADEDPGTLRNIDVTATIEKNEGKIKWQYPDKESVPNLAQQIENWQKEALQAGMPKEEIGDKTAQMIVRSQIFNDANTRVADLVKEFYKE